MTNDLYESTNRRQVKTDMGRPWKLRLAKWLIVSQCEGEARRRGQTVAIVMSHSVEITRQDTNREVAS